MYRRFKLSLLYVNKTPADTAVRQSRRKDEVRQAGEVNGWFVHTYLSDEPVRDLRIPHGYFFF